MSDYVTIEQIAEALGISVEAAKRRAEAEGWAFIEVDDQDSEPEDEA